MFLSEIPLNFSFASVYIHDTLYAKQLDIYFKLDFKYSSPISKIRNRSPVE